MDDTSNLHNDGTYGIEPDITNAGQKERNGWFREGARGYDATKDYSAEGFTMMCAFKHDFYGLRGVFPPQVWARYLKGNPTFLNIEAIWGESGLALIYPKLPQKFVIGF